MTKAAVIDPEFECLQCPVCEGQHLHWLGGAFEIKHYGTRIVSCVDMPPGGAVSIRAMSEPFDFRPNMRLAFWCEHGCNVPPLIMRNHKGFMLLEWLE